MTVSNVRVALADRAYDIRIGRGALDDSDSALRDLIGRGQAAIVADATVWHHHGDTLRDAIGEMPVIEVPPGEASKNAGEYARVSNALLEAGVGRDGVIIAFGGGVVGDLTGFCAATLRRGCRFVQIPTTLLAQVDSSVGGKTAINSPAGKNLIGAFHQPSLVITDLAFMDTLPDRELKAGYAEVIKYGLLGNADFFAWLESNNDAVLGRDDAALTHAIKVSCQMKADIVAEDETEKGRRALLNLGHTFGHALEAALGYSDALLHGEAVAAGMGMAFRYSVSEGICSAADAERATALLARAGLPTGPRDIHALNTTPDAQLELMYQDKKVEAGALTFILVKTIGEAFIEKQVPAEKIHAFLKNELAA